MVLTPTIVPVDDYIIEGPPHCASLELEPFKLYAGQTSRFAACQQA